MGARIAKLFSFRRPMLWYRIPAGAVLLFEASSARSLSDKLYLGGSLSGASLYHLNLRVAWHDSRWNGRVCRAPSKNTFCTDLDRIRIERDEAKEDAIPGKDFSELKEGEFPPCQADSGAFMNDKTWWRILNHPYQTIERAKATHGNLTRTPVKVPPYSTFAVPFRWLLRQYQDEIEENLPTPLPPDENASFKTPWVFSRERQEALCELFFSRIAAKQSLVFFYTKSGHPLDETINRLIVGAGQIEWLPALQFYEASKGPRCGSQTPCPKGAVRLGSARALRFPRFYSYQATLQAPSIVRWGNTPAFSSHAMCANE